MGGYAPAFADDEEEIGRKLYGIPTLRDYPPAEAPAAPRASEFSPISETAGIRMPNEAARGLEATPAPASPAPRPAQQRLNALVAQGAPPVEPLHGAKRVLDVLGQMYAPRLEKALRYPKQQAYASNLAEATAEEKAEEQANPQPKPKEEKWTVIPNLIDNQGRMWEHEENSGQNRPVEIPGGMTQRPKEGATTDEQTLHDLMTGDNGRPRINPQTQKPYSYLEAFAAVKQAAQDTKAPVGNDFEQFYRQQVKEGLPDTAANRQASYAKWVKNEPQYQAAQAQREAMNADRNEKREERQGQAVYGYDAASGHTRMMSEREALDKGLMYDKVTVKQVSEDRQLNNRLNDVRQKIGRFEQAMKQPINMTDRAALVKLLGEDKVKLGLWGVELPVDWWNKANEAIQKNYLSKQAADRLIAFKNAKEAMVGYQRVLSGSARSSEKAMELNIGTLPIPVDPQAYSANAFDQFKENLNIAGNGLPEGIPGVKTAQEIEQGIKPQVFKVGNDVYDIPPDKVDAFKKKHPNAAAQ